MIGIKKVRKLPQRTCVGCGNVFEKKILIRIVRNSDGIVELDTTGKKAGRGAYVCSKIACLEAAIKGKKIERALDCQMSPENIERLREEIKKNSNE